jgi:hypothetical protein
VKALVLTVALLCLAMAARAQTPGLTANDMLESCKSVLDQNYNPAENLIGHMNNGDTGGIGHTFRLHETRAMCLATVGTVREVMDILSAARRPVA